MADRMTTPALVAALSDALNAHAVTRFARLHDVAFEGLDASCALLLQGRAGIQDLMEEWLTAFPDLHVQGRLVLSTPKRAVVYWTLRGTQRGPFLRIPPTGRPVTACGSALLDLQDGVVRRGVYLWDLAGVLRALHLLPELPDRPGTVGREALPDAFLLRAAAHPSVPPDAPRHPSH